MDPDQEWTARSKMMSTKDRECLGVRMLCERRGCGRDGAWRGLFTFGLCRLARGWSFPPWAGVSLTWDATS